MTWRIPTDDDFKDLEMHLGMSQAEADATSWRGTNEGSKLAGNAALWDDGALESDAEFGDSGFMGLPAGYRSPDGSSFGNLNVGAYWWSSSQSSSTSSWNRFLNRDYSDVGRYATNELYGCSLRCVRDTTVSEDSDTDGTIYTNAYTGNDGKTYDAVKIGDQVWINENLKETKYNDGTNIPELTVATDWENDTDGARCAYNNDANSESDIYGYLYNWFAVDNGLVNPGDENTTNFFQFF